MEERVTSKIFIGFELTPNLKFLLNKSKAWKEASVPTPPLEKATFNEKEYLGKFLKYSIQTRQYVEVETQKLKEELSGYTKGLEVDTLEVFLFSKVFVQ